TQLVSVMAANNETGVIQPLDEVASLCREIDVPLHTDAVQVAGKLPLDFRQLNVAAMTVTAHKFHGPRGVGILLIRPEAHLQPQLFGGFQQDGLRPGTESVELAVGMQAALELWQSEAADRTLRMTTLRDSLAAALLQAFPQLVIAGYDSPRLPHTLNIA